MRDFIYDLFIRIGVSDAFAGFMTFFCALVLIGSLSFFIDYITKKVLLKYLAKYIRNNKNRWDDYLLNRKVFTRLSHIIPGLVIYLSADVFPEYQVWIQKLAFAFILIVAIGVIDSFLNSLDDIYRTYEISKEKPIKGYIQVVKIFVYLIFGILVISTLIDKSPLLLLSGFGALTAVLMLVFKDSILGLVAGIQLASNDMVRIGDWIEMPKYGADGDVVDISLNIIKVQNFDKTITTIPTYSLTSDSFKNWRNMQRSGGRRIKRSLLIDIDSISFCTEEMISRFKKINYLSEYIQKKIEEIEQYNKKSNIDPNEIVNGRRLTNIGTLRAYIYNYLMEHPKIHKGLICMVRQLPPGEHGVPIEIYAFTNDTDWIKYEGIQADIFDHIFAIVQEFGLRIFQDPTGNDFRKLGSS